MEGGELLEIFTEISFLFLHFSFLNIFIHIANISCLFLFTLCPSHKKSKRCVCVCVWVNTIGGSASYIRRPVCRVPLPIFHFPQFSAVVTFHFSYVDCHTHTPTHTRRHTLKLLPRTQVLRMLSLSFFLSLSFPLPRPSLFARILRKWLLHCKMLHTFSSILPFV